MATVWLVAWNEVEGVTRKGELESLGYTAVFEPADPGTLMRSMRHGSPSAVVIDLSRSPAQGRDFGVALRIQVATRRVPLVFAGGSPEKVERVKKTLPDAEFSSWDEVGPALQRALRNPPAHPVVPDSRLAGYSGTPLPLKLGVKASTRVLLAGAPKGFESTLGPLPEGAALVNRYGPKVDLILWFVRSRGELEKGLGLWVPRVRPGGIWIIWPKKSSGLATDLQQTVVRKAGLDAGLVDYKIAAVDGTWSGLKFALRRGTADVG